MRLFFALMPSDAMVAALQPLMTGVSGARWQGAAQLHCTLRFVGEVSARVAEELADALRDRAVNMPPVDLAGVGFFESHHRPNALWVRAAPKEPLAALHHKFDRACQAAGLEPERRAYLPHITVARLSRSAGPIDGWLAAHAGFAAHGLAFDRCALCESVPTDAGSHYEELAWVGLA